MPSLIPQQMQQQMPGQGQMPMQSPQIPGQEQMVPGQEESPEAFIQEINMIVEQLPPEVINTIAAMPKEQGLEQVITLIEGIINDKGIAFDLGGMIYEQILTKAQMLNNSTLSDINPGMAIPPDQYGSGQQDQQLPSLIGGRNG